MRSRALPTAVLAVSALLAVVPPGVGAQSEAPAGPNVVEVMGTSEGGPCPGAGTVQVVDGVEQHRGTWCNPTWVWTDPRLNGTATYASNEDRYPSGLVVGTWAVSLENEGGVWRMRPETYVEGLTQVAGPGLNLVFHGEGAYEGLVLIVQVDNQAEPWRLTGYIVDGETPTPPETASVP